MKDGVTFPEGVILSCKTILFPEGIMLACKKMVPVGSRVSCNPIPIGTDYDVLALVDALDTFDSMMQTSFPEYGFDGSDIKNELIKSDEQNFISYTNGNINLIATDSEEFFKRFVAATGVAKKFNLLNKPDRVMLFQAVLYGNGPK